MATTQKILLYGTNWCGTAIRAKKYFEKLKIDFEYINIDTDIEGAEYVKSVNKGKKIVPTIVFPSGEILVEPTETALEKAIEHLVK